MPETERKYMKLSTLSQEINLLKRMNNGQNPRQNLELMNRPFYNLAEKDVHIHLQVKL